jgi:hypothetical protein
MFNGQYEIVPSSLIEDDIWEFKSENTDPRGLFYHPNQLAKNMASFQVPQLSTHLIPARCVGTETGKEA